jgi:hypothetical protein
MSMSTPSPQQRPSRPHAITTTQPLDLIVRCGIPELDSLLGGFHAGALTLIDGNSSLISELPNQLCAQTYQTFHSPTLYIDGGMAANPYRIASYARMLHLDANDVLSSVSIARAFTLYQLTSLIHDLEPVIQQHQPRTLIIGRFPSLYLDPDVPAEEATTLLATTLEVLKRLTTQHRLITVLTNKDRTILPSQRGLRETLYGAATTVVRIKELDDCIYLDNLTAGQNATIVRGDRQQLRLDAFIGG